MTSMTSWLTSARGLIRGLALLALLLPVTVIGVSADAEPGPTAQTYTNPVGDGAAANFADPTVIRGRDGYWYAYATNGARFTGDDKPRILKIARSADLVEWEYVGEVFTPETQPTYDGLGPDARRHYWAPDIEYANGRYLLYYSYVVNDGPDRHWRAIGVATAPAPGGPWTDSGQFVTGPETWEPRPGVTGWRNVIDPEVMATPDGERYLFYGSVLGGVRVVRLSDDGLRAVGERVQLTQENRYEASDIYRRGDYYYLFLSAIGGCCHGPVSGYPVHVARSRNPLGPYYDRAGHPINDQFAGGTPVQAPNGNRWVSVGHSAVATDLAGQDWLVTHGIDRSDPYIGTGRGSKRHLLLAQLDWIDGWPTTRAGRWAPDEAVRAPAVEARVADSFEAGGIGDAWEPAPGWRIEQEPAGGFVRAGDQSTLTSRRALHGDVRVRTAVRLGSSGAAAGLELGESLRVSIDREQQALVVEAGIGERERTVSRPLPDGFTYTDWHELSVELRDGRLQAKVSTAGLHDYVAIAELRLPRGVEAGQLGLWSSAPGGSFDDVTAADLFTPVTEKVPDPDIGAAAPSYGTEFSEQPGTAWEWVRESAATVEDGALVFPVQQTELAERRPLPDDSASLLVREPPPGTWTAETKVTVPFGDSLPYGWPQAGMVAYTDGDEFVNLTYSTRVRPRYVTFGTEQFDGHGPRYAFAALGPAADTMWLRLRHTVDPANGEHEYRAATSVDGNTWMWHGVRTLPAGPQPRLGLAAFGVENPGLTARFDYVRFTRP